jgi:DNA-binding NarL/FixJ family response regulator
MAMVLCTGHDLVLMETRKLILEEAGHIVIPITEQSAIPDACKKNIFDVAVIGQSFSAHSKRSIASLIRQHCPSAKILELYQTNQDKALEDADSWLEVPADVPQKLAQWVTRLAKSKPRKHG